MRFALIKYSMRKVKSEWGDPSLEQEKITALSSELQNIKTKTRKVFLRKEGVFKVEELEIGTSITEVEKKTGPGKEILPAEENLNQNM